MKPSMQLYWKLYFENYSTESILQESNAFRNYKDEMIEGPIIDIGCGQSEILLDFIDSNREIFAIDNEQLQLDYLKQRVINKNSSKIENWRFIKLDFIKDKLPSQIYSLIVCSNLLHFFTLQECIDIINSWIKYSSTGTLFYIKVHSKKHPKNNLKNEKSNYKHFFSLEDMYQIFKSNKFEKIYQSETEYEKPLKELKLINNWLDKWHEKEKTIDAKIIQNSKDSYLLDSKEANITIIFRKR